jgi:hypothetical protein
MLSIGVSYLDFPCFCALSYMKFDIWLFFENLSRKFKFHLNRSRIKGTLLEDQYTFLIISGSVILVEWKLFQTKLIGKLETHIIYIYYFILLNNQRDAALSSRIYFSLQGYSTCFGRFLHLIIRSTIKIADAIIGTVHVSEWFKSVERCPRSGVYFTMSWPN